LNCMRRWRAALRRFLRRLIAAVPHKVHTVLTDNRTHFTTPPGSALTADGSLMVSWIHSLSFCLFWRAKRLPTPLSSGTGQV
jgi:hypothetical protein